MRLRDAAVTIQLVQRGEKEHFCLLNWTVTDIYFLHDDPAALFCKTESHYKSTDYTKKNLESQIPSGQFSSSVWAMTSWASLNHEGLSATQNSSIQPSSFQSRSPLPHPDLFSDAEMSVRFSYSISCHGLESDQSGIVKRARSTPQLLNVQRHCRATPLLRDL